MPHCRTDIGRNASLLRGGAYILKGSHWREALPMKSLMPLKTKVVLLAVVPLVVSLVLIALVVRQQEVNLASREKQLVESAYMTAKETELKHYVELALSVLQPLYETGRNDAQTQGEAMRLLATLDYGADGYFFLYDMSGKNLMHARQKELVGQNLWDMQDPTGLYVIRELIAKSRAGGGFVRYMWRKPSSAQVAPKLGYVVALERWGWMLGTGLYLDDIEATMAELDGQVKQSIEQTMLLIAGIAVFGIALIGGCGVILNLSEHKIAYGKLQLLTRQVVQSQEDERAHLSRELHDGTSQTLVSIKLLVESAIEQLQVQSDAAPPRPLTKALVRLNDALTEIRRISHRLRPALLDTLGLGAALRHLGEEFGEHSGVVFSFAVQGEEIELPDDVKTVFFRLAQEALTNIEKHAQATRVDMRVCFGPTDLVLEVRDDGQGFDLASVQQHPSRGIGLRNMRERMQSIGGRCVITSRPRRTAVRATAPLAVLEKLKQREVA